MLMSQEATSSGAAMRPRFGFSASAALETTASTEATARRWLCINMLDFPILRNAPARDPIEMVECLRAAIGDELGARRLEIAGIVGGAALQDGRSAGPVPRHAEPRQRHRQGRVRQRRQWPPPVRLGPR